MISPSSSARMRMIPCMAGCAGPMPTVRFCPVPVPLPSPSMISRRVVAGATSISNPRADQRLTPSDRVVLAQRMADELFVHQKPAQVRVAVEADAEHVPPVALEPVGDRPERDGRRHHGIVLLDAHLDAHALVPAQRI